MKRNPFGALLDKISPPEGLFLLILSVVVGGATGLAAVLFIHLIAVIQNRSGSTPNCVYRQLNGCPYRSLS